MGISLKSSSSAIILLKTVVRHIVRFKLIGVTAVSLSRFLNWIIAAVFSLVFLHAAHATNERRVALIIGNAEYTHFSILANPPNDTALIAEALKAAKFDEVRLVSNLTLVEMSRALQEFSILAAGADIAMVYFAGHGVEVEGINYLVPVNAKLLRSTDVSYEGVSLELARTSVSGAKKLRMVILDACRNNPFKLIGLDGNRAARRGLRAVETNSSEFIAYSAKEGTFAQDGPADGNSPFAIALAKAIAEEGLEVRRLFGKVRDDVLASTGKEQEPFVYASIGGEELFLNPPKIVAPAPITEDPIQQTLEIEAAWQITKSEGTLEAFEGFKTLYAKDRLYKLYELRVEKHLGELRIPAIEKPVVVDQPKLVEPKPLDAKTQLSTESDDLPSKKATNKAATKRLPLSKRSTAKKKSIDSSVTNEPTIIRKRKPVVAVAPKQEAAKTKNSKPCFDEARPWMHAFRPRCK
jgi:hypothetical protein